MSLIGMFKSKGPNGFGYSSTAQQVTDGLDLTGKTYLLTGSNSGIGHESLRVLTSRGAHVVAAARTEDKARAALDATGGEGTPVACELSEPSSVHAAVDTVKATGRSLDGIICNAGIMALPKLQTQHGYEAQFFTNHIGHFILVTGLVDNLADNGRVVMLSSSAHRGAPARGIELDNLDGARGYSPWKAYGQAKLANLLFARHLAKRLEGSGKTANALHPGVIATNLGRHMAGWMTAAFGAIGPLFLKTPAQGAATQCYLATHPSVAETSGEYFADCNPASTTAKGRDAALAEELWAVSEKIVAEVS